MHEAAQSLLAHAEAHLPWALAVRQQKPLAVHRVSVLLRVRYHHANLSIRKCWLLSDSFRSTKKSLDLDAPIRSKMIVIEGTMMEVKEKKLE